MSLGIWHYITRLDFGIQFWLSLIATGMVMIIALPIHEFAHGFVANKLGDPTARHLGRLDMNPLAHLDPIGSMAILLFGFGWAKPVPVDPRYFKNERKGMALTAFAGPLSNVLLAWLVLVINKVLVFYYNTNQSNFLELLIFVLNYMILLNISLAVFNLIPIPPLDGSKVIAAFMSDRVYYKYLSIERYGIFLVYFLMFTPFFNTPISYARIFIFKLIDFSSSFVDVILKLISG